MFARGKIFKNEEVIIWGGDFVNQKQAEAAKSQGMLVMQFGEDLFSIEKRGESNAYFLNHSCSPNLWMKNAFTLQSMRNIKVGEELLADYALWEANENYISKWDCMCQSSGCRNKVTGKDWQISELQIKYRNHFSPLINKRVQSFKL